MKKHKSLKALLFLPVLAGLAFLPSFATKTEVKLNIENQTLLFDHYIEIIFNLKNTNKELNIKILKELLSKSPNGDKVVFKVSETSPFATIYLNSNKVELESILNLLKNDLILNYTYKNTQIYSSKNKIRQKRSDVLDKFIYEQPPYKDPEPIPAKPTPSIIDDWNLKNQPSDVNIDLIENFNLISNSTISSITGADMDQKEGKHQSLNYFYKLINVDKQREIENIQTVDGYRPKNQIPITHKNYDDGIIKNHHNRIKIGIIDVSLVGRSTETFSITNLYTRGKDETLFDNDHGPLVANLIAGKRGINRLADLYSTTYKTSLWENLEWFEKNNVPIVNISLGKYLTRKVEIKKIINYWLDDPERIEGTKGTKLSNYQINEFKKFVVKQKNDSSSSTSEKVEKIIEKFKTFAWSTKIDKSIKNDRDDNIVYTANPDIIVPRFPTYEESKKSSFINDLYDSYINETFILDYFSNKYGITFFVSAGNNGGFEAIINSRYANAFNSIVVGATDNQKKLTQFSQWNKREVKKGVLVTAPGESIWMNKLEIIKDYKENYNYKNFQSKQFGGTSAASPITAALISVLLRENYEKLAYKPHGITSILASSSTKNSQENVIGNELDPKYGAGFVNYQKMQEATINLQYLRKEHELTNHLYDISFIRKQLAREREVKIIELNPGQELSASIAWLYNAGAIKNEKYRTLLRKKLNEAYDDLNLENNIKNFDLKLYEMDDKNSTLVDNSMSTYSNVELIRYKNTSNQKKKYKIVIETPFYTENYKKFDSNEKDEELAFSYVINDEN